MISNKFGIIIQARTGSKRLPNKVFHKIGNKTLLDHIVSALKKEKLHNKIIIATTNLKKDIKIIEWSKKNKIKFFSGSHLNVLDRFYKCALKYKLKNIVRFTADNPFVDTKSIMQLLKYHEKNKLDYSSTLPILPKGVGTEVFTISALKLSYLRGNKKIHKEHVNEYILRNIRKFKIGIYKIKLNYNSSFSYSIYTKLSLNKFIKNYQKYKHNFKKYKN